jgi:hypothetical protein
LSTEPFDWVRERARPRLLVSLTVLLVGISLWMLYMDRALVTPAAPHGIVSYELAGDFATSHAILQSWSPPAKSTAILIQGVDYLYPLVYSAWLSLAIIGLGSRLGGAWRRFGAVMAWIVLGAGLFDAVENYALIAQLMHGATAHHARLAWWCAVPKFALIALGVAFLVLAGSTMLARRRSA